jgi:hypothetical protein
MYSRNRLKLTALHQRVKDSSLFGPPKSRGLEAARVSEKKGRNGKFFLMSVKLITLRQRRR